MASEVAVRLLESAGRLSSIGDDELRTAWGATVEAFRTAGSEERRRVDPQLLAASGWSAPALQAGLEAVLGGAVGARAEEVLKRAGGRRRAEPLLVVLAGNLSGLLVQPLLPALALRRPTVLKPASRDPGFTDAFVDGLVDRLPALAGGVICRRWRGGEGSDEERTWLELADPVVAYGEAASIRSLRSLAHGEVLDYGPKLSLAVAGRDAEPADHVEGLARDVALFEQEGCLSVQALFVEGPGGPEWAVALAEALVRRAEAWPPPDPEPVRAARVQQVRAEARSRGLPVEPTTLAAGTVLVEELEAALVPSPGMRTVRIYPVDRLEDVVERLTPFRGLLQGVAGAGAGVDALQPALRALGATRFTLPGELQAADVHWMNGGRDLVEVLAE